MPPLASMQLPWASWLLQALPVHVALHGVPAQLSSWTGTPVGSPGCAVHGFGPVSVCVPVLSRSLMFRVPASWPGEGGQFLDRAYTGGPCDPTTLRIESMVHAWPRFGPPSQVPWAPNAGAPFPLQRGQTCEAEVRCTLEKRFTASGLVSGISPVWTLILAVRSPGW